jgi:pyochelin biosynthetic protein PchC
MALGHEIDVRCVQYPGRQDRRHEPCLDSIGPIADGLFEAVQPVGGPFALFGHSMGATVAFELARRLERVGQPPAVLFVSGRQGPSVLKSEMVHLRDDHGLIDEVRELSGTEQELLQDPDVLAMILPALRSDYRAIETYRRAEGEPLSCPIVVLTGDSDPRVSQSDALAWACETTGPFEIEVHPGGHFYLGPRAAQVNAQIRDYLGRFITTAEAGSVRSSGLMQ